MSSRVFPVQSVAELEARFHAERSRAPFLLFRDGDGRQQIVGLPEDADGVVIGRAPDRGIRLAWDPGVSAIHALLKPVGGAWTIVDDGLSRNGTYVNEVRVVGRRRLADGDVVRCGSVLLEFRHGAASDVDETVRTPGGTPSSRGLTPAQRRVLVALCRPLRDGPYPATNKEISAELSLSVDAVKTHLRRVCDVLGIEDLPQNQKRAKLAYEALRSGVVTERELLSDG